MGKEEKELTPYHREILEYLCRRQNNLISSGEKDLERITIPTTVKLIGPILEEINRERGKAIPLKPERLAKVFRHYKKEGYLKPLEGNKQLSLVTSLTYQLVNMEMVPVPEPKAGWKKKRKLQLHQNIRCRKCNIVDGYLAEEKVCRHCGADLFFDDAF